MNFFQPGKPVRVGERNALLHFCDVGGRVKIIGIEKSPAQPGRKQFTDCGFSRSGCAHQ